MYDALKMLLEEECKSLNCGGKFADDQEDFICFEYAAGEGPIAYFESFPVITLMLGDSPFIWHPSEYFYRKKEDRYCLGLKAWEQTGVMLGTFGLRQKLLVFNLEQNQLEFVPFICSSDQFRVTNLEPKPMKVKATDEL